MQNKISYSLFILICTLSIQAQQLNPVDRLLASVRNLTTIIIRDTTVSIVCKKNIKEFSKVISVKNKKLITENYPLKLINSTQLFIISTDDISRDQCKTKQIYKLIDSAKLLLVELDKFNIKSNVVKIKLSRTDAKGWGFNMDSASGSIRQLDIKDSMGYILVLLYAKDDNDIKIITDNANSHDSNLKVIQYQNQLVGIQLPRKDSLVKMVNIQAIKSTVDTKLNKLQSQNNSLFILVSVLFFLTLATIIFCYTALKKLNKASVKSVEILSHLQTKKIMDEIKNNENLILPVDVIKPSDLVKVEVMEQSTIIPAIFSTEESYFICETMMTAGPRKKPMSDPDSDKDLGEDVCGFVSTTKEIFIWLLDGTSDDDTWKDPATKKEYFSSRLLAQCIGDKLRNGFIANPSTPPVTLLQDAIVVIKKNWLQIIGQLPTQELQLLKKRIESKMSPICSTTALIGHLRNNGDFKACRIGDSQMFLFNGDKEQLSFIETTLMGKSEKSVLRIFFRLQFDNDNNFEIVSNNLDFDIVEETNIQALISFSDGIGQETELIIKEQYSQNPNKIKQEIIYQLQGTGDDKTICFIERKIRADGAL